MKAEGKRQKAEGSRRVGTAHQNSSSVSLRALRGEKERRRVGTAHQNSSSVSLRVLRGERTRAISLLEVLIAMAVITIGLLSVAALIPTGQFAVVEATKSDRAAACGRAALAETKTRQVRVQLLTGQIEPRTLLDSITWCWPDGTSGANAAEYGDAFLIDPLFVATNVSAVADPRVLSAFPYGDQYPPVWTPAFLHRVTLRQYTTANQMLPLIVAERVFHWTDDLAFQIDRDDHDARTRADYVWSDGTVAPAPVKSSETAPTGSRLRQEYEGRYSWMLTVSPASTEIDSAGNFSGRKYQVSAVVFFRRDLEYRPISPSNPPSVEYMPTERWASVVFNGGGYGGGDAAIFLPTAAGSSVFGLSNDQAQYDSYLGAKKGTWILLMGLKRDNRLQSRSAPLQYYRRVAQWYRVLIADDDVQFDTARNAWYRNVTLAGPDWDPTVIGDASGTTAASAVLVDGVIGVYTKTIDVD